MKQHAGTWRVMVVVAHPDDAEYAVAGTVARWTGEGREVIYVLVTDGNAGTRDETMTAQQTATQRRAEQRAAAAGVGVQEVVFLGYDDAILEPTLALRRDLTRVIRRYQPQTVICQDSSAFWLDLTYINHPDHRAAGEACLSAVFPAASTRLVFPELLEEGLPPHRVQEVYLTMTCVPDCWIDIGTTLEQKLASWRENTSRIVDDQPEKRIVRVARDAAQSQPGVIYAEALRYFDLR